MSATMVGQRRKKVKLHWLKRPQKVQKKQNFDQKISSSKPHIWSLSFTSRFSSGKSQNQHTILFRARNIALFEVFIVKTILPQHSQKPYSLYEFSS